MHAEFFTFALIMLLIVIAPYVSRISRLPITVVEILFGSVGAYVGFIEPTKGFEIMSEIGFLFLMFLCGLEVEIYLFKKIRGFSFKTHFCLSVDLIHAFIHPYF